MKLMPFQEEAVAKMLQFLSVRGATYNACEMGLGKSAQALTAAKKLRLKRILILCPASVQFVWKNEVDLWYPDCTPVVVSYGKLLKIETLHALSACQPWDLLICDEAHYLKSPKAKRTKAVLNTIWESCRYKICLSGTPMTQSVADCWTTFSKIMPELGTYWQFCERYAVMKYTPWGYKPSGIKHADELKKKIRDNFFVRYLKSEVLKDLPAKTWVPVPLGSEYRVRLTPAEERESKEYLEQLKRFFITGQRVTKKPPVALATARKKQGLKKVEKIAEFCTDILEQEIPLIVFAYHTEVIKQLTEALKDYAPQVIQGSTSAKDREEAVTNFQGGNSSLFIGQLTAAGTGITLHRASTVVFAELDWSPAQISQAVDRAHRIGQKDAVTVYYFTVEDSIDEELMDTLIDKVKNFAEVIN